MEQINSRKELLRVRGEFWRYISPTYSPHQGKRECARRLSQHWPAFDCIRKEFHQPGKSFRAQGGIR